MRPYSGTSEHTAPVFKPVSLEKMLSARDRRAEIQAGLLDGRNSGFCLVCLTLNIAGEIKRTPMTRMLFLRGMRVFGELGFDVEDHLVTDDITGSEAFWLLKEDGARVKGILEEVEDSFPAARLFDFDVLVPGRPKLSRAVSRRCLICDAPAAECARSRRHGLDAVKKAQDDLLESFCADTAAGEAYAALLDELYTTPKPGLVDMHSCGAHKDMDVPLIEKSAAALRPFFRDAVIMGIGGCTMGELRRRGLEAEETMFEATGGVNAHKGIIYSMGLLLAGFGMALAGGGDYISHAAGLAAGDAHEHIEKSRLDPVTNGGNALRTFGAKGAMGEAAEGFPGAKSCAERLRYYREAGSSHPGAFALCDSMAVLEDTNLLHRGGRAGLDFARKAAAGISLLPEEERTEALFALDDEMIRRNLSPGGSADMLALAYFMERAADII